MVGESGTSASKGRKYHYYRCVNTKKNKTCSAKHKSVRKLPLENAVVNATMAKVMDDNFVEYISDAVMDLQGRESSELPALRQRSAETERGIENMLNAIRWGLSTSPRNSALTSWRNGKRKLSCISFRRKLKNPCSPVKM